MSEGQSFLLPDGVLDAPTSYGAWIDECEARHKRGERQKCCTRCSKWRWDDEVCCNAPRMTAAEVKALERRVAREVRQRYPSGEQRYQQEVRRARKRGEIKD